MRGRDAADFCIGDEAIGWEIKVLVDIAGTIPRYYYVYPG